MKINVGCGANILDGYKNIDVLPQSNVVMRGTLINMPFEDACADEILAEHIFEHMDFKQEPEAWAECHRVLKPNGRLVIETPDFEWVCKQFIKAKDEFNEFYQVGAVDHYFGNGRSLNQRWGILSTMIWGNQNGEGQYHKRGYTEAKLRAISELFDFEVESLKFYDNKGGRAIRCVLIKRS